MTLRNKFLIPTILMIIIGLGASTLVSHRVSKSSLEQLISNELVLLAESTEAQLDSWLMLCRNIVTTLSDEKYFKLAVRDTFMGKASQQAAHEFLLKEKQRYEFFDAFYVIRPTGLIVTSSETGDLVENNVSRQEYYMKAMEGQTVVTDITRHPESGSPICIIASPIYEHERIVGVLSGHINLNYFFDKHLSKARIGKTGHAMLAGRDGTIIYHPEPSVRFRYNLRDLNLPPGIGTTQADFTEYTFQGSHKKGAARVSPDTGWTIMMAVEVSDIMKPVRQVNRVNISIIMLCLLVSLGIVVIFRRMVTAPLKRAIDFAQAIQQGDFTSRLNVETNDEIGHLSQALEAMARQLEKNMDSLAAANKDLKQEQEAADAANKAKSEFLANMSHEFRTPLNAVAGFSEILYAMVADAQQKRYVKAIQVAGKSLMILINDILDLSKIEAGKLDILIRQVDIRRMIHEIELIFSEHLLDKDLELVIVVDKRLPGYCLLDEARLRQVLLNLVGNAVKFTDKGRIKITMESRNQDTRTGRLDLSIAVEDTGRGIPVHDLSRIFESFQQLNRYQTETPNGTGLGLAICKRLVEAMNGAIEVESTPGKGSIFRFTLKQVKMIPDSYADQKKESSVDIALMSYKTALVLVVDDIPSNRKVLSELCRMLNLSVVTANNGSEAVAMAKKTKPDLIFMDIKMPVVDGFEAARQIKSDPDTHAIPIVVVTASVQENETGFFLEKGFDSYISKPIHVDKVVTELSRFLTPITRSGIPVSQASDPIVPLPGNTVAPDELKTIIIEELSPALSKITNVMIMHEVKDYAGRLQELGMMYQVPDLERFGSQLNDHVEVFDMEEITRQLKKLPGLLDRLIHDR